MESFLKLYFGGAHARSRVIMTGIYLISITIIISSVLKWFGLTYGFPKEISVATAFNFVFSGQILLPIAGILFYYTLISIISAFLTNFVYDRLKFYLFRAVQDDLIIDHAFNDLFKRRFINWNYDNKFQRVNIRKGFQFHEFEPWMKSMFWDDFTLMASSKLYSEAMFALMLALGFNYDLNTIIKIVFYLTVIGWLLFTGAYWSMVRQNEYRQIYEQIYFNLNNPESAEAIWKVSTVNSYYIKYQRWEFRKLAKKRLKRRKQAKSS